MRVGLRLRHLSFTMNLSEPKDKMSRESTTEENNPNPQEIGLEPDSRFSSKEKWFIVTFVAFVGLFRWVRSTLVHECFADKRFTS